MNPLEKLAAEYEATKKIADTDINAIPSATRGGWGVRITEAKERMKTLHKEYKATLLKNGVAIFIEGDAAKAEAFAKLVLDEGDGLTIDANALYDRLSQDVEATISDGRQWGVAQTHRLHLGLQEVIYEVGLSEMPMPSRDSMPYVPSYKDTRAHVKRLIRDAVGGQLNRFYVEELALKQAIAIRYMGMMAPVLILNADTDETSALAQNFAKGTATVKINPTDEVTKDFLAQTFKDVNKKIRAKKQ